MKGTLSILLAMLAKELRSNSFSVSIPNTGDYVGFSTERRRFLPTARMGLVVLPMGPSSDPLIIRSPAKAKRLYVVLPASLLVNIFSLF